MAAPDHTIRRQCGALPFAITGAGELRLLLVTTRGRGDWIIPKGWPIRNLTPAATAAQEAYEEAGLIGTVVGDEPVGFYRYEKRGSAQRMPLHEVAVFLFAVERQRRKWPEKAERQIRWFSPEEACGVVASEGLADILRNAIHNPLIGAIKDLERDLANGAVAVHRCAAPIEPVVRR